MFEIPQSREVVEYVRFGGGIVETVAAAAMPPGALIDCVNYEPVINGGYRRVSGYERFDGRSRPSDVVPVVISCSLSSAPPAGTELTIGSATCLFVKQVAGGMIVVSVSGSIAPNTAIMNGAVQIGTTSSSPYSSAYSPTHLQMAEDRRDCSNVLRQQIGAVPGSGSILGVVIFKGNVYAVRNNAAGTAADMYVSSSSGWQKVDFAEEVYFTNANASIGGTLTQGSVTATILKVIVTSGSLGSSNKGKLVIGNRTGGSFSSGAATTSNGGTLTLSGQQQEQSLPPGGKYDFDIANFYGSEEKLCLYGANGVGRAFEFDGTVLAFIDRGDEPYAEDKPSYIRANRGYLYTMQKASVISSSVGDPHRYVTAEGAAEFGIGADGVGLVTLPGAAIACVTSNSCAVILGETSENRALQVISPQNGGSPWTIQHLDATYSFDDIGVIKIEPTDVYGNFVPRTESSLIFPTVSQFRNKALCSVVSRQNFLYRIFMSDGQVLVGQPGKTMSFTKLKLKHVFNCAWSGRDNNGNERIFAGSTEGYVYELDRGSSFDGEVIDSTLFFSFNSSRGTRVYKRYKRVEFDCSSAVYARVIVNGKLTYDDGTTAQTTPQTIEIAGSGGVWGTMVFPKNVGVFDSGIFDSGIFDISSVSTTVIAHPSADVSGIGTNLSINISSTSDCDFGHTFNGVSLHFIPRRIVR